MFELLEQNFLHGYGIKSLLKKLDVADAPNVAVNFLMEFGPLFEQITLDFQRRQEAQTKLKSKEDTRSKEWSLASESNNGVEQLEDNLRKEDEDVAALNANILKWKK